MNFGAEKEAATPVVPEQTSSVVETPLLVPKAAASATPAASGRRVDLRPLASLLPYIRRYRWRAACALGALIVAALTTLVVPIAVRRMIDFGFAGARRRR